MWDLDHKESWGPKSWCFWTIVLEKTLESPLDCKEIQPVHSKGNESWMFIGRTDAEPDAKNWLIGKDPDAGKDWRQEKGSTEDKMVEWYHWHSGHEFEQAPGVGGDGQGSLECCSPWGRKQSEVTEWLNWTDAFGIYFILVYISLMSAFEWKYEDNGKREKGYKCCYTKENDITL